jgi:hypothetical protein
VTGVQLSRGGISIVGDNFSADPTGFSMMATFALLNHTLGQWDLVVDYDDGGTQVVEGAFVVEQGSSPPVSVDIHGQPSVRVRTTPDGQQIIRSNLTGYKFIASNHGNVDARGQLLVTLPLNVGYQLRDPFPFTFHASPPSISDPVVTGGVYRKMLLFAETTIPAGASRILEMIWLDPSSLGPHQLFTIDGVWFNHE